ncbi:MULTISPECIES: WYL domain-containing protein [unclassified Aeromonas]|uniref:WYL domain-containing protein n=1 Tax=unclassified Aeromonas TaxID=257493 RepID=UPI0022E6BFD7|nr:MULTISPECIES: WYL domain-containing protein [unclassified Aeromonas]
MGNFLLMSALVFLVLSVVCLFKPSIFRQKKRSAAFCIGFLSFSSCLFLGFYAEGLVPFWNALVFLILLICAIAGASQKPQVATKPDVSNPHEQSVIVASKPIEINHHKSQPFDRSFKSWESELTTAWAGDTDDIEFTYVNKKGERTRRSVTVEELLYNESMEFYIKGYCHVRGEQRTFKADNIDTKIKVGSQRLDFDDWCERKLGIDLYDLYHA